MEAAAAPAITTERAKMRTASFMMSNPSYDFGWTGSAFPVLRNVIASHRGKMVFFSGFAHVLHTSEYYLLNFGNPQ